MEESSKLFLADSDGLSFDISAVSEQTFLLFVESEGLKNRAIEVPSMCDAPDTITRYCVKVDHSAFAICLAPVTYHDGEVVKNDYNHKYINQVQFLGFSPHLNGNLFRLVLSQIITNLSDNHLILIKTCDNNVVEHVTSVEFVRISGIRESVKQYAYLPQAHTKRYRVQSNQTPPHEILLDTNDSFYYNELCALFSFNFKKLVWDGWTIYARESRKFLFTLTSGTNTCLHQPAFRLDVFDCVNGMFTAYNDVHVPENSNTAFNDLPAIGFTSVVPAHAQECLKNTDDVSTGKPETIRNFWQNRDALWVHPENRNLGIATTLERIACDVCKYLYPSVRNMQVCVHFENPHVYYFHKRNGAQDIEDGLYRLAYDINGSERPLIKIISHSR